MFARFPHLGYLSYGVSSELSLLSEFIGGGGIRFSSDSMNAWSLLSFE